MKKYLVFIFGLSFLFISFLPNLYELSLADKLPADRVMLPGEHIYTYDFNVYLSKIRQGQEGRWSVIDKYDNNPHQKGVFLQMIYLLAGKLTAPLKLSPVTTYQILRLVAALIWIYTIIWLNIHFLKKPLFYTLGTAVCLLTSGWPIIYRFENSLWVKSYMDWWQELDVIKRISFLPHDSLNYVAVALFISVIPKIHSFSFKQFFFFCLLASFSVLIHPTAALVFFVSWLIYIVINKQLSINNQKGKKSLLFIICYLLFLSLPLLYIRLITSTYPWKALVDFDQLNRLSLNIKDYILALGPVFFTGIAGLIIVLIKKEKHLYPLVCWILAVAGLIFLFKFFPFQSELRFIQTANHIPLAILTVWLISQLLTKFRGFIRVIIVITIFIILLNGLVQSYFSIKAQNQFIRQRALATLPIVPYPPQVMYPIKDFYNALLWLEKNTPRSSIVLSKITAGNYIPAYSGNFVYLGHNPESTHFEEKERKADLFFSGNLNEDEALKFLKQGRIDYIFYGPQERENYEFRITDYRFLEPVFQSEQVTIFKIKY